MRRLLAEDVPKHQQQADGTIHEDQFLNFLVNTLTDAFSLDIGENAEIDPENIYEVLVGASADGTSISTLCKQSDDALPATDILYHLRTKFDLDSVKAVSNTLLQEHTEKCYPGGSRLRTRRVRFVASRWE